MGIVIDASCEKCGGRLNIYTEWDSTNVKVTPCEYCEKESQSERDALQAKLDIAVEALKKIATSKVTITHANTFYHEDIAKEALKKLDV